MRFVVADEQGAVVQRRVFLATVFLVATFLEAATFFPAAFLAAVFFPAIFFGSNLLAGDLFGRGLLGRYLLRRCFLGSDLFARSLFGRRPGSALGSALRRGFGSSLGSTLGTSLGSTLNSALAGCLPSGLGRSLGRALPGSRLLCRRLLPGRLAKQAFALPGLRVWVDELVEVGELASGRFFLVEELKAAGVELLEELVPADFLQSVVIGVGCIGEFETQNAGLTVLLRAGDFRRFAAALFCPFPYEIVVLRRVRCHRC